MPRSRSLSFAMLGIAAALAACSGNLGSGGMGGGLPVTQGAQGYQQPQGPSAATSTSRERVAEGAVYLSSDLHAVPLPALNGFALSLSLATAAPEPSSSASANASASPHALRQHTSRVVEIAQLVASPAASGSPLPASASPSVTPAASPSPSPGLSASPKAGARAASPSPAASGAKIQTKLVIYPDYAPDAPTPQPSGNVQTFTKRKAIVRGYVSPAVDVPLYGLAAARFTIPTEEQTPNRGYTVAVFTSAKKHHDLIASDPAAMLVGNVVASSLVTPLTLKKGIGYDIVLYGDELPSTPAPVSSGYATPGTNPFVTPMPSGFPGAPNGYQTPFPGQPTYPGQTPYPGQTYGPGVYPTLTPSH